MFAPVGIAFLMTLVAAADGTPSFNVGRVCREAARRAEPVGDIEVCLRRERAAREELIRKWAQFAPDDKSYCVQLSSMGGEPTYTELLTCLELSLEAKNLRDKKRGTTGQGEH